MFSTKNRLLLKSFNADFSDATQASVGEDSTDKDIFYLNLKYNIKDLDESENNKASFAFVSNLDFSRVSGSKATVLTYKKAQNNCNQKYLDFTITNGDIFDLIKEDSDTITLKPALTINSLPKVTGLVLDGQIELEIGLKLPF